MTLKEQEEITNRHDTLLQQHAAAIKENTTTLAMHTTLLNELTTNMQRLLERLDNPSISSSAERDIEDVLGDTTVNNSAMEASLYAITGSPSPTIMRVQAYLKNRHIAVLLDSGSTHNFIHPSITRECDLKVTKI